MYIPLSSPKNTAHVLRVLVCIAIILLLAGCQSSPKHKSLPSFPPNDDTDSYELERLYDQYKVWRGTPYRLGGNNLSGIDCSAFVKRTYEDLFGITLPRTTSQQILVGHKIGRSDLETGDLVFFRSGKHVGIYLEDNKFMHASTRLGVTISRINNVYWSRYYWRAIRIKPQR
ncbi:NlpC/P60 family protein [Methylophaga sp.]|uniref:NlpC/P60 family protein n=1 Tax=Methylophaga sp. TaxID=2024840 RepID=UPI003F6972ED